MNRFTVYLYTTSTGGTPVADEFEQLRRSDRRTHNAIDTAITLLEQLGPGASREKFKRLKHVGAELWEIRVPGYRVLFAPVPGEQSVVLLLGVRKTDMDRRAERFIAPALARLEDWLRQEQRGTRGEQQR